MIVAARSQKRTVDRVPFQDEHGPAELLLHFCEPCVMGFGDEQARRAYVIGLLVC